MHHAHSIATQGYGSYRPRVVCTVAAAWTVQLSLFTLFALQERRRIGHWPTMNDPATLGLDPHSIESSLLLYGFYLLGLVSAIWTFWVTLESIGLRPFRPVRLVAALVTAWAPLIVALALLPRGLFEWLFD